ncbi:MAG: lyase family protein [Eubacteriales bacterium]
MIQEYTHLQRAQPVTFGHWILAYAFMLSRDVKRPEQRARTTRTSLRSARAHSRGRPTASTAA